MGADQVVHDLHNRMLMSASVCFWLFASRSTMDVDCDVANANHCNLERFILLHIVPRI